MASKLDVPLALPPLRRDGLFWLTLALTAFAVAPFALPGYFWGANDARHHVYFLFEYNRLVEDGIWWPRWSPDFAFGYGYPFFNIYGPLSHFLAQLLLHFLGFEYTAAIKSIFALSVVGSAGTMYAYVRVWAGRAPALLAALVYTYIPYHLLNLYVRANLAESMAFVWMPLCLLAVRQAIVRPHYGWVVLSAGAYAALMLTSNLVIVLFTPVLALYAVTLTLVYAAPPGLARPSLWAWLGRVVVRGLPGALGLAAGLGLSAVFWLPMLLERQYVRVDQWFDGRYNFRGHFVYFHQLFSPQWGFGASTIGPDDTVGYQIGVMPLLLVTAGLLLVWPRAGRLRWEIGVLLLAALGGTFLGLVWAAPLWEVPVVGGLLGAAQFPWRWFSMTALGLSALAGLPLMGLSERETNHGLSLPLVSLATLVILASYPLLRVEIVEPAEGPVSLAALMRFQQSSDEMTGSTAWVREIPTWSPMADEYIAQEQRGEPVRPVASLVDYTLMNYNKETGFVVNSEARSAIMEEVWYWSGLPGRSIVYNHFYYPGWRAYLLDGRHGQIVRELAIVPEDGPLGRMTVPVDQGEGYILLRFEDTPPRIVGRAISQGTLVLLALVGVGIGWRTLRRQRMGQSRQEHRTT